MSTKKIRQYYDATAQRKTRDDLAFAVRLVEGPAVAIDCGCGAGSDIEYLLDNGFMVHAFDNESEAISRCEQRFRNNARVALTRAGFESFDYPQASLVLADASLFFCPADRFDTVWNRIRECLLPGGIFVGTFIGPEDTMARPGDDGNAFWPATLVLDEQQTRGKFPGYEIVRFTEHKASGQLLYGSPYDWHVYAVVARKI